MTIFCCRNKGYEPPPAGAFDVPHCDANGVSFTYPGGIDFSPEFTSGGSALPGYYEFAAVALSEYLNANGSPGAYFGSAPVAGLFYIPSGTQAVSLACSDWYAEVDPDQYVGPQWPTFPRLYTVAVFVKLPGDTEFQYVEPTRITETGDGARITIDLTPPWIGIKELPPSFTTLVCGGTVPGGV